MEEIKCKEHRKLLKYLTRYHFLKKYCSNGFPIFVFFKKNFYICNLKRYSSQSSSQGLNLNFRFVHFTFVFKLYNSELEVKI